MDPKKKYFRSHPNLVKLYSDRKKLFSPLITHDNHTLFPMENNNYYSNSRVAKDNYYDYQILLGNVQI